MASLVRKALLLPCLLLLSFTATAQLAGALKFTGFNAFVDGNIDGLPQGNSPRTIEFWYNTPSLDWVVFAYGDGYVDAFDIKFDMAEPWVYGASNAVQGGYNISSGWYHFAVTYDGTTMRVYRDGVLMNSQAISALATTGTNYRIGRDDWDNTYGTGTMDELRIWNVARTQAEISGSMNSELTGAEAGLVAYFNFNQGTAGGTNTGLTCLHERTNKTAPGTLYGFALTGNTSNWVAGQYNTTAMGTPIAAGNVSKTATISGSTSFSTACDAISMITPSGAAPVSGSVETNVYVDGSVPSFNGQPYVQRRYDIEPAVNPDNATATITLYYTQAEFDAYNAAANTPNNLPIDSTDSAGKSYLHITQHHGTSATGMPGSYTYGGSGAAMVAIDPADNNIVWNSAASRWEVTFDVTGFSGFFAYASVNLVPLPVKLESFTAVKEGSRNRLSWKVASESEGMRYEIERSADAKAFGTIATASAKGSNAIYTTYDDQPLNTASYYRLRMLETDGTYTYSPTAMISSNMQGAVTVAPVPSSKAISITNSDAGLNGISLTIVGMQGREMHRFILSATQSVDISSWPVGIYSLRMPGGEVLRIIKN